MEKYQCTFCSCYIEEMDNGACHKCVPRVSASSPKLITPKRMPGTSLYINLVSGDFTFSPITSIGKKNPYSGRKFTPAELLQLVEMLLSSVSHFQCSACGHRVPEATAEERSETAEEILAKLTKDEKGE